jgi:dihydromethanopterin reductase
MINLIAAVGTYGEIGYKGRIPWRDDTSIANITDADLGWFAKQTSGDLLIVGSRTYEEMLMMGFRPGDREVVRWNGQEPARIFLDAVERANPGRDVWVCGGAWTYKAFMPFVQRVYISRIPWTGPADRYMPPIIGNWGYVGGPVHG